MDLGSKLPVRVSFEQSTPSWRATALGVVTGLATLCVAPPVSAASPRVGAAALLQPEDSTLEAQRLYREGQNFYETANYTGAIEKWTTAYGLMDWGPETAEAKTSLLYNLAAAHEKQYGISKDVQNLRTAKVLLQSFSQRIPTIYGETDEAKAELDRVEHRIAEIDAQLDEAGATPMPDGPDEPEPEPEAEPETAPEAEPAADVDDDAGAGEKSPRRIGKPLFYSGAAAIGLGVAAGGGAIAFTILSDQQNNFDDIDDLAYNRRIDQIERGLLYNELAVGLGVAGGVLVVGGVVLVLVGKKRMAKEESNTARLEGLSPMFGQGRLGAVVGGRF